MINSDDLFYITSYKQDIVSDNIFGDYFDLNVNKGEQIQDCKEIREGIMSQLKRDMFIEHDTEIGNQMMYIDQFNSLNTSLPSQTTENILSPLRNNAIQINKPTNSKDFIHCSHCKTKNTSLWRRQDGLVMCNACALYKRLHGIPRPLYLNSGEIKKRNRSSKRFK
jgi:hypothetical protein